MTKTKQRLVLLERLYKRMPKCQLCRRKATRKTFANGVFCDEHAKRPTPWLTEPLPWAAAVRALEKG